MSKKALIIVLGTAAVLVSAMLVTKFRTSTAGKPIAQLVAEKGIPTFLAKWVEVDRSDLRVLRLLVLPQDPQAVTNWNSITEAIFVWADSEPGRRKARYFYEDIRNGNSLDGGAWYSRESLFRGEKVTIIRADTAGVASTQESFRVDAFSMRMMGFVAPKPPLDRPQ